MSSDESDREALPSISKRRKYEGSATYCTRYQPSWEKQYGFVARSTTSSTQFYCKVCRRDVSIAHQGILDIKRHSEGKMHKINSTSMRSQSHLNFKSLNDPINDKITAAEVRNTVMIAHHNAALCMSDHIGAMQRKNFPDSQIASKYHCARTKTACILNYALAPYLKNELVAAMKTEPYSLSVDASNDKGISKMNPLTVRIFDVSRRLVSQKFLDLCLTTGVDASKSYSIFEKIDETLQTNNIPWDNCTAFGVDNTNTNIGERNSIKSRVTAINPSIYFVGCPCHIIHNAAQKAGDAFCELSGFDVEECCVDHYYWFDKSTKRKGELNEYAVFCDVTYQEYIHHINVRWLSLERAVERILMMFVASKSYFISEEVRDAKFKRLALLYKDPMFEIYLLFYQATLPVFTTFNLFLQRDAPQIYTLYRQMQSLLKKILSKFIKPSVIQSFKDNLTSIPYFQSENQLEESKIFIGLVTGSEIKKKLEGGDILQSNVRKFYDSVKAFYVSAVKYVLKWFPFSEAIIKCSEFVDLDLKEQCDFSMVLTVVERYPKLLGFLQSPQEIDKLNEEFVDYQALSKDEVPKEVWEYAACYESGENCDKVVFHRMDVIWSHLAGMKIPGTNMGRFDKLSHVAKVILTIPHSNAGEERVFSVIRKIKREDRGKLQLEGSLSALVTVKLNLPETKAEPCYEFQPSKELLKLAKSATSYYNKEICAHGKD